MAFTAKLGTAESYPGNVVPGYGSALGEDTPVYFAHFQVNRHEDMEDRYLDELARAAEEAVHLYEVHLVTPVVAGTPSARRGPAPPVPIDPDAQKRTRQHQQIVAQILNSLVRRNEVVSIADLNWTLGYNASAPADWDFDPPTTVGDALDTLAANEASGGGSIPAGVTAAGNIDDEAVVRGDGGVQGIQTSTIRLGDTGVLYPATSDAGTLGSTTNMWSDLHLASGGVINWNNGAHTLYESPGDDALILTGGGFRLTAGSGGSGNITLESAGQLVLTNAANNSNISLYNNGGSGANELFIVAPTIIASTSGVPLTVRNAASSASVQVAIFEGSTGGTPATNDLGYISYRLENDGSAERYEFARMTWVGTDITVDGEDCELFFSLSVAGALTEKLRITGTGLTVTGSVSATTYTSTVSTGTAPFTVSSTTKVANLNADLLDDQTGSYYLDSANFTGTNWTDLTDGGATTLHTHAYAPNAFATIAVSGQDDVVADGVADTLTLVAGANITLTTSAAGDSITIAASGAAVPTTITVADTTDSTCFVALFESATGDLAPKTDGALLYDASTGQLTSTLIVATTAFIPDADDGAALGTTSLKFSDLFLASEGVINFDSGNATITHSAGLLTSNVDIAVPDEAYGSGWNASTEAPTKNAVYDKIESLSTTQPISVVEGRLTLTSATPVLTADVTAATTIYFTPYKGNRIYLYDGSASWAGYAFSEISVAVPSTTSTPFDIFAYDSAGSVTLETTDWTNDTTRATALTLQNGVLVKSGATTRRYLGTGRTTTSSGQCEMSFGGLGSQGKRYLWNYYNRVPTHMSVGETATSWTYNSATYRPFNNSSTNSCAFVIGVAEDSIDAYCAAPISTGAGIAANVGIGVNSSSSSAAQIMVELSSGVSDKQASFAVWRGFPRVGENTIYMVEAARAGTATFYGDFNNPSYIQAGLVLTFFG